MAKTIIYDGPTINFGRHGEVRRGASLTLQDEEHAMLMSGEDPKAKRFHEPDSEGAKKAIEQGKKGAEAEAEAAANAKAAAPAGKAKK